MDKVDVRKSVYKKERFLRVSFGYYYEIYKNYGDDRYLFCKIYDMLLEALEEMKNVRNLFIWCAFNDSFKEEVKTLQEIIEECEDIEEV